MPSSLFASMFPLLAAAAYCALDFVIRGPALRKDRHTPVYQLIVFVVVAASLYGNLTGLRVVLVVVLVLIFTLGHGYRMLTGDTLRPEGLVLASRPDHLEDALEVVWTDFRRMRRAVAAAVGWGIIALAGTMALPPPDLGWPFALLGPACLVVIALRAARLRNHAAYPRPEMPALIGVVNALGIAAKWAVTERSAARASAQVSYRYSFDPFEEPALVVVIMGESISPDRMGLFRPGLATTPHLLARSKGEGQLAMSWRLGLSGGVASNASLTALLCGLQRPELGTNHKTLFELAKARGFRTHYLSPQPRSPLDMTGRLHAVDSVETRENNADLLARRADYLINDKLAGIEFSDREFFFLYQRVNHAPYRTHDEAGRRDGILNPKNPAEIIHNYDLGLDAWDRHVESVLCEIERRLQARPQTRCFVFVSSDHNEVLGDAGYWGHNISGRMECAVVPMMLFTNVPEHPVAQQFASAGKIDFFDLSRAVQQCFGVGLTTEGGDASASYVGNALPYGRAGYMTAHPDKMSGGIQVATFSKAGVIEARYALRAADLPGDRGDPASPGLFSSRSAPRASLGSEESGASVATRLADAG